MLSTGYVIFGLLLLVVGGDFLLRAAVAMALRFKLPKAFIGMTVVSLATSFPELVVSLNAALKGNSSIALGNVIGSNISNIGFILGITALFSAVSIKKKFFQFDFIVLMLVSFGFTLMLLDFDVSSLDAFLLLIAFTCFIYFMVKLSKKEKNNILNEEEEEEMKTWKMILFLLLGGVGLWQGSEFLIKGAIDIASQLGLSDRIIGLTIVAFGTSVPELAASLLSIYRKENDISLGNIVGSNIFNILFIMGTVAMISPIDFQDQGIIIDALIMSAFALLILPLAYIRKRYEIGRWKGFVFFMLYILFIYLTIINS